MLENKEKYGQDQFARTAAVSRETMARFKAYAGLLADWNARHNLVSARSLEDVWQRHFADSAQLLPYIPPDAKTLADIGSGAGFPGLVLAELLRGRVKVTLFEATAKKCAFLTVVAERLRLEVEIRNMRIEDVVSAPFDVITARACAPLPRLLSYAQHLMGPHSVCLFLKGQNLGAELTEAHKSWKMKAIETPSITDPEGRVLEVRELTHGPAGQKAPYPRRRQPEGRRR